MSRTEANELLASSLPALPLGEVCKRGYEHFADDPAVRDDRERLTYRQLGERARRLANAMRAAGAGAGSRIAIVAPNSCQWTIVDHATAIGGFGRVGLLTRLHVAELAQIAADVEPDIVFADGTWLDEHGRDWIPKGVKQIVVMGDPADVGGLAPFDQFLAAGVEDEMPVPEPEAIAWVLYTSGSTGQPKGVVASQRAIGALIRNCLAEMPQIRGASVALHTAPVSHFSGGICRVVEAVGGLNVLEAGFDPAQVVDVAEAGEVTMMTLVPTMIAMVVDELVNRREPTGSVGSIDLLPYGASAIQPDLLAKALRYFGDGVLQQLYGASEAQMPIASLRPEDHVEDLNSHGLPRLAAAGKPTRFVKVEIVDEQRRPLPPGEPGEIKVSGENISSEYWRRPEETASTFVNGWVFTGDVGYIDENGYLYIVDRRKDMVITGGFNVYPREVENSVATLAGVREVAVVGAPDPKWGEVICAVISTYPDVTLTEDEVIAHCRASLAGYKVPKRVEFVSDLPKSGVGKIQKTVIREQLWAGRSDRRV